MGADDELGCADSVHEPTLPSHSLQNPEVSILSEPSDSCTLVDPSYVIRLIRQLLPNYAKEEHDSVHGNGDNKSVNDNNYAEEMPKGHHMVLNSDVELISVNDPKISGSYNDVDRESGQKDLHNETSEASNDRLHSGVEVSPSCERHNGQVVSDHQIQQKHTKTMESLQEEAGCILWDLATNPAHAEFMVDNHLLDVVLAVLSVDITDRTREICLGIMGNLACHDVTSRTISTRSSLVEMIIQQLFFDDSLILCEVCRLLSAGLHSEEVVIWAAALQPEHVLQRILWIASNTMNLQLLEKSTELLLAMVDIHKEALRTLIVSLLQSGLPEILIDLLACEVSTIAGGTLNHGEAVLDNILQIGEALSLVEDYSSKLASNNRIFDLACEVIKLCQKDEIGPPRITAAVLVANLLAEQPNLIDKVLNDSSFLESILEILPDVCDDLGARNAVWSVLDRYFDQLSNPGALHLVEDDFILVLARQSSIIAEDLAEHRSKDSHEKKYFSEQEGDVYSNKNVESKFATVNKMIDLLNQYIGLDDGKTTEELDGSVKEGLKILKSIMSSI